MENHWDAPVFPVPGFDSEPWSHLPVAGQGDVVRVVLHADGQNVWLDPVYDDEPPTIQVVSAGQVGRTEFLRRWCWMVGHHVANLTVLEGTPITDDAASLLDQGSTLRIKQTDGVTQLFVLERRTRNGCRVCGYVDRDQPPRVAGTSRLHPSMSGVLPSRTRPPMWQRSGTPWHPWGPISGFYGSWLGIFGFVAALLMSQTGVPRTSLWAAPAWVLWVPLILLPCDLLLSTVCGHLRSFLEDCGARFELAHPFGDHPGDQPLLAVETGTESADPVS